MKDKELKTNHKIELAREFILKTNTNIFLTGKAGTGKTTFLQSIVKSSGKRAVVAAPTGVAALNAGGVTLHSLFKIPFGPHVPNAKVESGRFSDLSREKRALVRSMELLIIDEISMVRCDIVDKVDQTLRRVRRSNRPFGGVQLLLIGDIQQLTPICREEEWALLRDHYQSPYFFDSIALRNRGFITIELDEIFRQRDTHFTDILNAIRENRATTDILNELNKRYLADFEPPKGGDEYITLTTHNNSANAINSRNLAEITSPSTFYAAEVTGDFPETAYPNDTKLELKVGAQVLFIKNDSSQEKKFYNGMIGRIVDLDSTSVTVRPKSGKDDKDNIVVEAISWENLEYSIDKSSGEMKQHVKGTFMQIPLKCAWAITIHKSQGLSFDHAIIDAAGSFAHGQVYVALSRCRTLEGMVLKRPIPASSIIEEQNVEEFNEYVATHQPTKEDLELRKKEYFASVICNIFEVERLQTLLWKLASEMSGAVGKAYPKLASSLVDYLSTFEKDLASVSKDFQKHLQRAVEKSDNYTDDAHITERLKSATAYFKPRLESAKSLAESLRKINIDAEITRKSIMEHTSEILSMLTLQMSDFAICEEKFTIESYQDIRAKINALDSLQRDARSGNSNRSKSRDAKSEDDQEESNKSSLGIKDLEHEKLYKRLLDWREEESARTGKRANTILSITSMMHIQQILPTTLKRMSIIRDFGRTKLQNYGADIVNIIKDYCELEGIDPFTIPL